MINNGTHILTPNDIVCNNGVIQPIDGILEPPPHASLDLTISQVLIRDDTMFQDFTLFLMMNNMLHVLDSDEYTVFAPTNAAFAIFANIGTGPTGQRLDLTSSIMDIFNYHIVPGKRTSSMLTDGQILFSLFGAPLNVTKSAAGELMVDYAQVVIADIPAKNGVIHAIDNVLVPIDIMMRILGQIAGPP